MHIGLATAGVYLHMVFTQARQDLVLPTLSRYKYSMTESSVALRSTVFFEAPVTPSRSGVSEPFQVDVLSTDSCGDGTLPKIIRVFSLRIGISRASSLLPSPSNTKVLRPCHCDKLALPVTSLAATMAGTKHRERALTCAVNAYSSCP